MKRPLLFFLLVIIVVTITSGVVSFYTERAKHGRTSEERAAYAIGEKAGEEAPADAKLPYPAELNMMAQREFKLRGTGTQADWNLGFERGYEAGFKKTHK
jgi:hypothetical protein